MAEHTTPVDFDIAVIGAGLHGAGIALEAAGRGLKTLLIHAGRPGGSASCMPSDLVDAGLDKLEQFEFADVLSNFQELARLRARAPHLVRSLPTYIIQAPDVRSPRRLNMGVNIYRRLQKDPRPVAPADDAELSQTFAADTQFSAAIGAYAVSYTRLIIALLQQLEAFNAVTLRQHRLVGAGREKTHWQLEIRDLIGNETLTKTAKIVINCAGCDANVVLRDALGVTTRSCADSRVSAQIFVKLAQRWSSGAILQHPAKSTIGMHKLDNDHLCIGPIVADDNSAAAKARAVDAFVALWNAQASVPLRRDDIVHCRWSLRPLVEDPTTNRLGRANECFLDLNNPGHAAPLLNVFGNNFVQYRKLAQQALDILAVFTHKQSKADVATQCLPGGDFAGRKVSEVIRQLQDRYDFLPGATVARLVLTYGTRALDILQDARTPEDLGQHFGHGLYQREVSYLREHEWAECADDILWRRTYLGLAFSAAEVVALDAHINVINLTMSSNVALSTERAGRRRWGV